MALVRDNSVHVTVSSSPCRPCLFWGLPLLFLALPAFAQRDDSPLTLLELSLEDLANLEITSVSRRGENLSSAPASIYVITETDIRRSGASSLPEILRLAPNLQVAQEDGVRYSITARGFNNTVGNKLLVLVDGRTVYTPLFSGVFWEMQDILVQDIERVEVISGPGATLWGANAVNGVINVITRSAIDSGGALLAAEAGDRETGVSLRGSLQPGDDAGMRYYAKSRRWDNTRRENGSVVRDDWERSQAGFRADWNRESDTFTLQGDAFTGESEHRGFVGTIEIPAVEVHGMNLLGRWTRSNPQGGTLRVQAYWSRNEREEFILFSPSSDIFDLEFQHNFTYGAHQLVWGGGYRHAEDEVVSGVFTAILPPERALDWENIYLQDEFPLHARLKAVAGLKLEWNDYTGMEYLPTFRLAWTAADAHFLWAAASRAVRAPSRFDRDAFFPLNPPYIVAGGPDFQAEVARVLEGGYRGQLGAALNLSLTVFHHDWQKLRSGTPLPLPTYLANDIEGETWGVETWAEWQLGAAMRISAGLSTLEKDLRFVPGGGDTAGTDNYTLHNDPDYQWQLRMALDLRPNLTLDLFLRRIAKLTVQPVPAYAELNARLAWSPLRNVEVALTGRNLLDNDHAEFGPFGSRSRIDRSLLLGLRWTF